MGMEQNPALIALSRVLEDASKESLTPSEAILVHLVELRARTDDPTPFPPGYFISLSHGLEYFADMQGDFRRLQPNNPENTEQQLRIRFTRTGGLQGITSTFEANSTTLPSEDVEKVHQYVEDNRFFDLPPDVLNGDPLPDLYSYTLGIALGRRIHEVRTYDGTGPHDNPAFQEFIECLNRRVDQRNDEQDPADSLSA